MEKRISIFVLLALFYTVNMIAQTNWFAKVNGIGTGISWNEAGKLDDILAKAADGDIIYLAAGTYVPTVKLTNGTTDRDNCFEIKKNITIKGGYPANVSTNVEADAIANPTILSGKLNSTTNAYHVMVITAPVMTGQKVTLDGLTIREGKADASKGKVTIGDIIYGQDAGGGILAVGNVIDITNCIITNNQANGNAGCWMKDVVLNIYNTQIINNEALVGQTGGVYLYLCNFNMDKVNILNNKAKGNACGLYLYSSSGCIDHATISENIAGGVAGGMQLMKSSRLYMYNSVIAKNEAKGVAGGIYNRDSSYIQLVNCTVQGNTSATNGGAIAFHDKAKMDIINSTITGNASTAVATSGGLYFNGAVGFKARLYNSICSGNGIEFVASVTTIKEDDVVIKNQTIFGTKFLNVNGKEVSGVVFDSATMLGALFNNGGATQTCKLLLPETNPAVTQGLDAAGMVSLASKASLPGNLLLKDQRGEYRSTTKVALGSYQEAGIAPSVNTTFSHLILYGQSLGDGYQSYPALSSAAVPNNYMIGNQVYIANGNQNFSELSPLFASPSSTDVIRDYVKNTKDGVRCENPLVTVSNHIQQKLAGSQSILATSCAVSGTTIEQLSKHSQQPKVYYEDYLKTIRSGASIAQKNNYSISCPALFWMQGEYNYFADKPGLTTDTKCVTDKEGYKSLMLQLKEDMQADAKVAYSQPMTPKFITHQAGCQYIRGFDEAIAMAQLEASNSENDIICAGPVYPMTDRGGHLDSNGYRWYGEMLGKVYYKTVIGDENFKPLQPKKITKVDDRTLRIDFYVPVAPLVLDTKLVEKVTNYGFAVKTDGADLAISTITLDGNGESVIITCAENFVGDIEVNYGGEGMKGHGNLRDSDPYQAFYTYEDLDEKIDGEFVYPRESDVTTLRPNYEPQDESGVIYNKPYPLYNFGAYFYYKLPAGTSTLIPNGMEGSTVIATDANKKDLRLICLSGSELKIVGEWEQAIFYNVSGMSCLNTDYREMINVSSLTPGLHIIEVLASGKAFEFKYVK